MHDIRSRDLPALLGADEPAPFTVLNADSGVPILLVCDHASSRFPRAVGDLGVAPPVRRSHLAVDIGAEALTRTLASRLAATAVLARYSRLVIDCNRDPADAEAFLEFNDGTSIPGNRGLAAAHKRSRVEHIFRPYHQAVAEQIARLSALGTPPALFAMHSFTPVFEGLSRPWQIGVLWDEDERIAAPLIDALRRTQLMVGDNEPYTGKGPRNFTIDRHARAAGLPYVGIEVRNDLIDDDAGVDRVAAVFHDIVEALPTSVYAAANSAVAGREQQAARDNT